PGIMPTIFPVVMIRSSGIFQHTESEAPRRSSPDRGPSPWHATCLELGIHADREATVRLGLIGLGRMGGNMTRRLRAASIEVVGWTRDQHDVDALAEESGMLPASSLAGVIEALSPPRVVWLMLPAGDVTHEYVESVGER